MTVERSALGGLAGLLLLAFFLPWMVAAVMFVPVPANGFGIKDLLLAGIAMRLAASPITLAGLLTLLWPPLLSLLYVIPLWAAAVALLAFTGLAQGRVLRLCALGLGVFVAVMCFMVMGCTPFAFGERGVASLSVGFWLTALGGLGLIGASLALPRTAASAPLLTEPHHAELEALQARGQHAVAQATDWLAQRRVDLEANLEVRRIQYALGRRVNRTILDAHDTVIAPAGTVITNALIAQARHSGVLTALLDSVDATPGASTPTRPS